MGHSMGGSIATKACSVAYQDKELKSRVVGLIVIDVVEGTALEALPFMESIVKQRPQQFNTPDQAVKWR